MKGHEMPTTIAACPNCQAIVGEYDKTCGTCGKGLAGEALLIENRGAAADRPQPVVITNRNPFVAKFFWVVALLAAIAGGAFGFLSVAFAAGAPQEAAGAAIGCLIVIAPYSFARAVHELAQ